MRIITNADDFGFDEDTLKATIQGFESGALTSATIMATMPQHEEALRYAAAHPEFSFGCHLTWVGDGLERVSLPGQEVPCLAHENGVLRGSQEIRLKALLGGLSVDEIARETESQLSRLRDFGIPISHVDSHGHLHKFRPFREALRRVLPKFGIRRVRRVQTIYLRKPLRSPTFWLGRHWDASLMKSFVSTEAFYMSTGLQEAPDWVEQIISKMNQRHFQTVEIGVHPGTLEPWRAAELLALLEIQRIAQLRNHSLVSFHALKTSE